MSGEPEVRLAEGELEGHYALQGALTFETVPGLAQQGERVFGDCPALALDLGGVTRADSAGLALLVEWLRRARECGQDVRYSNIPEQMLAMARASGLDQVLPMYRQENSGREQPGSGDEAES